MSLYSYARIADAIRRKIISGEYPIETKLPTIVELATEFDSTSVTVSRALHVLAGEGYIVLRRGQGTFVIGNKPLSPLPEIRRSLEEAQQSLDRAFELLVRLETQEESA